MQNRKDLIILMIGMILVLAGIYWLLYPRDVDGVYNMKIYRELPENSVDVLFLGSSHSFETVNPAILYKDHGFSSFVLGGSVQPVWNSYFFLLEALKTQQPEVVFLELFTLACYYKGYHDSEEYTDHSRVVKNIYGLRRSRLRYDAIKASVPEDLYWDYALELPAIHGLFPLLFDDENKLQWKEFMPYKNDKEFFAVWKGYGSNCKIVTGKSLPDFSVVYEEKDLNPKKEDYLNKIIKLCKGKNIALIFWIVPYSIENMDEHKRFNRIKKIAEKESICVIDFTNPSLQKAIQLDCNTDLADSSHLNIKGAEKITRCIGNYLKDHYTLQDHREDPKYISWQKNLEYWEKYKK